MSQYIESDSQEKKYIQIPLSEYNQMLDLIEERVDIEQAAEVMALIQQGEETYPAELVSRLIETDAPIRVMRQYRNMTMQQLADVIGVSKSYISKIESGAKQGTIDTIKAIADALMVDLEFIA